MFVRPSTDIHDAESARLQSQVESLRARATSGEQSGPRLLRGPEGARELYESASTPEQKKIKKTADEFVSVLYGMLFKEMDKTVEKTGFLDGGKTEEMFRSFVLDEYSQKASSQTPNPLTHRVYEMLYEASSARRPAQNGIAADEAVGHANAAANSGAVAGTVPAIPRVRTNFMPVPAI